MRRRDGRPETQPQWLKREEARIGWRFWGVKQTDGVYRLRSPFRDTPWPVQEPLVAECLSTDVVLGGRGHPHDAPGANCRCGAYGGTYRGLRTFLSGTFAPSSQPIVIGRATLWGGVVEERSGWRAGRAYPERLLVPTQLRDHLRIVRDLEDYGVPVGLLNVAETFAALNPPGPTRAHR